MTAATIIFSVLLICLNGGFVALEFGLIGGQRSRIDAQAALGNKSARRAKRMQSDVLTTLGGAQLGITVCSLAVGRLAEPAVSGLIEDGLSGIVGLPSGVLHTLGFAVALGLVAAVHMVLGEMVPKNLALIGPERTLLLLARPMAAYLVVARPIVRALLWLANAALAAMRVNPKSEINELVTPAQFALMVSESAASELVDDQAPALVNAALKFQATTAAEVMTPISQAASAQLGQPLADVGRQFIDADTTRLLVYGGDSSDVRGFVHCTDLVTANENTNSAGAEAGLGTEHLRDLVKITTRASLPQVVVAMRANRVNLLLVTEGGVSRGVIRLDDLMDQLTVSPQS